MDVAPFYIDNKICNSVWTETVFQNVIPGKTDSSGSFSSGALTQTNSKISSSTFKTQDDSLGLQPLENGSSTSFRPQIDRVKCTFTSTTQQQQEISPPLGIEINIITAFSSEHTSYPTSEASATFPSPTFSPDSRHLGLPDSCSFCSSTDSVISPADCQTPPENTESGHIAQNGPGSPEPIYAESTKRKRKPQREGKNLSELSEGEGEGEVEKETKASDSQKATITVVAAHTEQNNRTFYLSSPDSAVSTQWPLFSPTALQDPCIPAFKWPTSSSSSLEIPTPDPLQPRPQRSPPLPPKRNSSSPKFGASLSPVPLPEFGVVSVSQVGRCPGLLAGNGMERRPKLSSSTWAPEVRIEEEEETEEGVADAFGLSGHPANGTAVCRGWNCSPSMQGEDTPDNSASQEQAAARVRQGSSSGSGSMLLAGTAASLLYGHDLAKGKANQESTPPPPPPKKQHR